MSIEMQDIEMHFFEQDNRFLEFHEISSLLVSLIARNFRAAQLRIDFFTSLANPRFLNSNSNEMV